MTLHMAFLLYLTIVYDFQLQWNQSKPNPIQTPTFAQNRQLFGLEYLIYNIRTKSDVLFKQDFDLFRV